MIIALTAWLLFGFIYTCALLAESLEDIIINIYITKKSIEKYKIYFRIAFMFLILMILSPFIFVVDEFFEV